MASRICISELNYGYGNVNGYGNTLTLYDVRIKKDDFWCNLEYIYKRTPLHKLYGWIMHCITNKYTQSYQNKVDVSAVSIYQEIHHEITIIFIKMSFNKMPFIKIPYIKESASKIIYNIRLYLF